jgi:hypothetical protein
MLFACNRCDGRDADHERELEPVSDCEDGRRDQARLARMRNPGGFSSDKERQPRLHNDRGKVEEVRGHRRAGASPSGGQPVDRFDSSLRAARHLDGPVISGVSTRAVASFASADEPSAGRTPPCGALLEHAVRTGE